MWKRRMANVYTSSKSIVHLIKGFVDLVNGFTEVEKVARAEPIMPIVSGRQSVLPFSDIASLIAYSKDADMSLGELGLLYEKASKRSFRGMCFVL